MEDVDILNSTLRMFAAEKWQRNGHKIQRIGSSTGHVLRDVALCDCEETAEVIIRALVPSQRPKRWKNIRS